MRHIASCAGGNDVGGGAEGKGWQNKREREGDWIGQSCRSHEEGVRRNNVPAHFLKPPRLPAQRGREEGTEWSGLCERGGKKSDGRGDIGARGGGAGARYYGAQ